MTGARTPAAEPTEAGIAPGWLDGEPAATGTDRPGFLDGEPTEAGIGAGLGEPEVIVLDAVLVAAIAGALVRARAASRRADVHGRFDLGADE